MKRSGLGFGPPYTASLGLLEKPREERASTSAPRGRRPSAPPDERPKGSREADRLESARAEAALVAESYTRADVLAHMRARLRAARRVDILPVDAAETRALSSDFPSFRFRKTCENSETRNYGLSPLDTPSRTADKPAAMSRAAPVPPEDVHAVVEVLYSREAIAARVAELGAELAAHYRDLRPVVLPVMSGAMFFGADLARAIRPRPDGMVVETIKAKSYEGTSSTGFVRVSPESSDVDVRDRHVLVVEDIVDTGGTLRTLCDRFAAAGAASVRMVALLDKRAGRDCSVPANNPHWSGFVVENTFVVGYGLDFDGAYRELEYVGALKPELYAS